MQKITVNTSSRQWQLMNVLIIVLALLYFGQSLFVPMSYGLLIAMVLYPVCLRLEKRGWPRSLAIAAGLIMVILLFLGLIALLILQLSVFLKDAPELLNKIQPALLELQRSIESRFHITPAQENNWWQQFAINLNQGTPNLILDMIGNGSKSSISVFLVPVYAALFLYNRQVFVAFLKSIVSEKYKQQLPGILNEVIHTYYNFIRGMIKIYIIVGVLNSVGLLALGIRHAVLFGMLTAIMTIIPYVGIIISALLPISVALITKDSIWYPVGVVAVFTLVQYLEANVIFPRVVAAQLKVSTWATLVAIIAGGIIWGLSGMILFIPFIGIAKLVLDYIPECEPVKILLRR